MDTTRVTGRSGAGASRARALCRALLEALDAARGPLGDLEAAAAAGSDGRAELVVATTAALGVFPACAAEPRDAAGREAAGRFLEAAADERREPPAKYRVTCPECGAQSVTEWTDVLPPGGVSPVPCSACGYMILSESEGDPVRITDGDPEPGAAACASSAGALDGRYA